MNKILILISIMLLISTSCYGIALNSYGHIVEETVQENAQFYREQGLYKIHIENHTLEGNSFFRTDKSYLTCITLEDNVPSILRLYDTDGQIIYKQTFNKIVNLTLSENKQYGAFFDGECITVLDLHTAQMKRYAGSVIFSVDNNGDPAYFDAENNTLVYRSASHHLVEQPLQLLFYKDQPLVLTRNAIALMQGSTLTPLYTTSHTLFEMKVSNSALYFVERVAHGHSFVFTLYLCKDEHTITQVDEVHFDRDQQKTHQAIVAPLAYGSIGNPLPIGNSYAEIQQYGYSPYLHPGVDFLGDDYENVYAVKPGYIKAILTTGGSAYWRMGIALENTSAETEGYLYAHLNQNSIPYTVGDYVETGDLLGTLYPWGYYDFTHIHFGRISCAGTTWNGNWWTTDNPLPDVVTILDTIPPVFENAYGSQLFAFRTESGTYLDPSNLMGEIDIIAKCHDIINSSWRVDVWDLRFKLHPSSNPGSTTYERYAFAYDMPLDTYISSSWDFLVLQTIYSRDATCYSIGDYTDREYYHIITNSDGDSVITEYDQYENLDTSQFPDGDYILEVIARDCSLNETSANMTITFDNVSASEPEYENTIIAIFPNPFNPEVHRTTCISLQSIFTTKNLHIHLYNTKGQHIRTLVPRESIDSVTHIYWDGKDEQGTLVPSGIYFSKVVEKEKVSYSGKIIMLR